MSTAGDSGNVQRVAIVTGGGSGIGRAVAGALSNDGYAVVVIGRTMTTLAETIADSCDGVGLPIVADVSDFSGLASVVDRVIDNYGRIDVLCNNAGLYDDGTPADSISLTLWQESLDTNVTGPFLLSQLVVPHMKKIGRGAVINVGSVGSLRAAAGGAAYTASKHALVGLTRQLAFELGPHGVRVNCVCPGATRTGMTPPQDPGVLAFLDSLPLRRDADPSEVAAVVSFLASDAASYVSGAVWTVDGGLTLGQHHPRDDG